MFDVENESSKEIKLNMRFIKLDGLSQINLDNKLYLCGLSGVKNEKFNGSSFICIDPALEPAQITFLVYSKFPHYYPSLLDAYLHLIVIGGHKNLHCEMFHKEKKTWNELADLPEERYNCNLAYDYKKNMVYLFGGFNSAENRVCTSILKLSIKKLQNTWETIVVVPNMYSNTQKIFSCVCNHNNGNIFILGGKSNVSDNSCHQHQIDVSDEIMEWEFGQKNFNFIKSPLRLSKNSTFSSVRHSIEFNGYHYMIDDDNLIHKLSVNEKKSYVYAFDNTEEYTQA